MNTLVLITYPANIPELQVSVDSFRRNMAEEFNFLIITESRNVPAIEAALPGERVLAMAELDDRIETLPVGYTRQMAAKLLAVRAIKEPGGFVVFVDDDVIALRRFNAETFTDEDGKPIIFYKRERVYPWMFGQRHVFGAECNRRFQLALPYVQSLESLRDLAEHKEIIGRAFRYWLQQTDLSEFQIMGEFELRKHHGKDTLRRAELSQTHWTLDYGIFKDWQNQREYLRKYLLETGQVPMTD